jgi:hypothetical protein
MSNLNNSSLSLPQYWSGVYCLPTPSLGGGADKAKAHAGEEDDDDSDRDIDMDNVEDEGDEGD